MLVVGNASNAASDYTPPLSYDQCISISRVRHKEASSTISLQWFELLIARVERLPVFEKAGDIVEYGLL